MYIPDFIYHNPNTLEEALYLLGKPSSIAPLAGGTDLLVEIKKGITSFEELVSLNSIKSLKQIEENDNNIIIGACTSHNDIINSDIIKKYMPSLAETCKTIGSDQIRNTGTIGGNLCTCASCADTAPILIANNAKLEITSSVDSRTINLIEFLRGHHQNSLKKGELLINIIVPKPKKHTASYFTKFGLRNSAAISVASVAISLQIQNDIISEASVVVGACASTPIECPNSIQKLINANISNFKADGEKLKDFGNTVAQEIFPIDDIRGSRNYRKNVVKAISQRALLEVINRIENPTGELK